MADETNRNLDREALLFHITGRPGKIEIAATKPLTTQRDLSLAYSPGVAAPCLAIQRDPTTAYDYTAKGNMVAVISNGTAVLGLGDLGALASKPVMEGKAVLFKKFADVDGIDLEVDTRDVDEFVNCVRYLGPTFGGINLEDIKAPECFIIEQRLRALMDIPVFHDDQHGTAIIAAAGLINALDLSGRDIGDAKMVVNGAGAAAIACVELVKAMGMRSANVTLCDSKGVVHRGRSDLNQWKSAHAIDTEARSLQDAMRGADVFLGLSVKGAVTAEMVATMAPQPIIFAMANPDPEITPEDVLSVRDDAIIATGRSDYPNQINNVLGFPYIFRGALDVRARTINDEMKIAAARAIAALAREDVPDEVAAAYSGRRLRYGRDYIIPVPFDPRLIAAISPAVAEAAMRSGVARKPIIDIIGYRRELSARLDPTAASLQALSAQVINNPKRVAFAEGEEEKMIRAALSYRNAGYGTPILIGRAEKIAATMAAMGLGGLEGMEIQNAKLSTQTKPYTDYLYGRLQRHGYLYRDVQRLVNSDRNVFAASMVMLQDADAMVTGTIRHFHSCLSDITKVIDQTPGELVFSVTLLIARGRTVFIADTNVHEAPSAQELADIAIQTAALARRMGHEPRVALLSYSTFGAPLGRTPDRPRQAVALLEDRKVEFEFDGEIGVHVALDPDLLKLYPFCRLSAPANVLIMPGLHSANISSKLMQKMGGATTIGPVLMGLSRPCQIVPMDATVSDIVHMATLAAAEAGR
ncbi:NADP-dependent malic enzyme [Rhodospirillum rubrum]|uniref:Malate dehydrogenase n=1 Tax=Rhodospirillum rubrum (strain ATCC 11170 / ATH 1.1.1 / DSM 467 / LMG 4362 / NCIMB 8255 / S1) TaxID=269796 RepID=Q2RNF9_RHORT|nr:NADP-dependent malic enzyme [Rhodospirillum rubrum]ABC24336.1 malate dehydrogenase [Rhodospirillum rubrum ATCC 11170]AEO50087.1 bifunctional malic enzyme oxidoreductase/phosphotransacetylase [Rhodospirillum rubrum F11]MBK5956056.1 NADP-dependent malic enzyme [Rhodospirillum rubrum]QXG80263.1 NADP-dependent malic enzyme [Rhodospirillum rubrum]